MAVQPHPWRSPIGEPDRTRPRSSLPEFRGQLEEDAETPLALASGGVSKKTEVVS
jgi:hypothetical protein